MDDLNTIGQQRLAGPINSRNSVYHPPVGQCRRVIFSPEDLHVLSVREVVGQDPLVALSAPRPDDADIIKSKKELARIFLPI